MNLSPKSTRLIFITGTDTGVGKTVLTGLLLAHLRGKGVHALGIKPFCSGDRADAELLRPIQDNELALDEISPFFFSEPVAPLAASGRHRRVIPLSAVLQHVGRIAGRCDCLLIEGIGGLLVPLGHNYSVLDLITRLGGDVIVVGRNQLGTLNHTLLTLHTLRSALAATPRARRAKVKIVLMQPRVPDASSASNPRLLAELLHPTLVLLLPFLGARCGRPAGIVGAASKLKRVLSLTATPTKPGA